MGAKDVASGVAGLAIAWYGVWYFFFYDPAAPRSAPSAPATAAAVVAEPEPDLAFLAPADQKTFQGVIAAAQLKYRTGTTDFQKGAARPARAEALCKYQRTEQVRNWVGVVATLTTNSDGKGVVAIRSGDDLYMKTWNNSVSDSFSRTLVEPSTKVFSQLGSLKVGQRVKFSGRLFADEKDCFREGSLTLSGSMSEPEFIMKFSDISPL